LCIVNRLQAKAMGEFSGGRSCWRHVANNDLSIGSDAGEDGGDSKGRV